MLALMRHGLPRGRIWIISVIALMLIAGHGFMFYTAAKHPVLSAGVVGGIGLLIVIKHLGLLGPALALLRRRTWKR